MQLKVEYKSNIQHFRQCYKSIKILHLTHVRFYVHDAVKVPQYFQNLPIAIDAGHIQLSSAATGTESSSPLILF